MIDNGSFLPLVIENISEGLCICHNIDTFPHVRFTLWNKRMVELTGYTMDEINRSGWYQTLYPDPDYREKAIKRMAEMRHGNNLRDEEWEITRADGQKRDVSISTSILEGKENITHVMAIMRDITEREQMEEQIRVMGTLVDIAPAAIMVHGFEGNIYYVNQKALDLHGYSREEFLSLHLHNLDVPESAALIETRIQQIVENGMASFEVAHYRKDRTVLPLEVFVKMTEWGGQKALLSIGSDITERKQAEEAIRSSEKQFHLLMDSLNAVVYVADMDTREVLFINEFGKKLLGDITGRLCWQTLQTGQSGPCNFCTNKYLLDSEGLPRDSYKWKFQNTRNGKWYDINDRAIKWIDGRIVRLEIATDITESKLAEEALEAERKRLAESQRIAHIGSWEHNLATNQASWSDEMFSLLGLNPEKDSEDFGLFFSMVHPDDQPLLQKAIEETKQLHVPFSIEYRFNRKGGNPRILYARGELIPDSSGELVILSGTAQDITERKQAEKQLEKIFAMSSDMICTADINGYFRTINPAFKKILGYSNEEILSKPFIDFIHPDDREKTLEIIENKLSRGEVVFDFENRYRCKDGSYKFLLWTSNPEQKEGLTYAVAKDITEHKQSEEALQKAHDLLEKTVEERTFELQKTHDQLLHAEKLSAIGQLSASIAHEFNNPLQGVMTIIKGVKRRAHLAVEDKKLIDMAVNECDRMKDLIKSLQDFNRPTSGRIAPMDIHATIEGLLLLSKKAYNKKGIAIEINYAEDMPQIKAVADQIKQVILNLLSNAAYACNRGCTITISTEIISKENIAIKIQDNGTGINPEHVGKIFDPFYTTKPEKKGTGLGLSVSYGIIKKHGGRIDVESEPGKGTTFIITLPVEGVKNAK